MIPIIYEQLYHIVTRFVNLFGLFAETPKTGRPRKISHIDSLTLALYQHASTRATKKSVYNDFKSVFDCSYKTLVESMNKAARASLLLLALLMKAGRANANVVKYTDATDIPVCLKKNADKHKTMKDISGWGRSSKGFYFGLKLTITRDADGTLLGLKFTLPSADDRDVFRQINADIWGIIVADAGYVSKKLEDDMNVEGKRWILIKPYRTMKKIMTAWQDRLYRSRFQIEFDFRNLKLFHGLVTNLPRSVGGYLANYLHALLSFVLA